MPVRGGTVAEPVTGEGTGPIKVMIITGDHGHDWKATTPELVAILSESSRFQVDWSAVPERNLTPAYLDQYEVLLLNYQDRGRGGGGKRRWAACASTSVRTSGTGAREMICGA